MPSLEPSAGPVDELEQGTPRPLSPVQDSDGGDGRRRDELQEKGRSALRARLFATHAASRSDDSKSTKRLQEKQQDQQQEMEALASSLQLSISVGQEATRDTDTLLKSLKISEEERTEERARALNIRNRLLNTEAKLLVVEQTSSGYKAQLLDKERETQELRHNLQTAEQAQREMQRDLLRSNSDLAQVKRELDQTSRTVLSADQEAERLRAAKTSLEQLLQDLRRRLTIAEDDARTRKGALEQQSAECEAFRNEVKDLRGKLDESESAQVKASSSWATAAGKCEVLLLEREQLEASKQSMAEQIFKLHSQLSEVRGLVEANMWEAKTKETALTEAKTTWDALENALRGEIRTLQQQLADAKQQLHTAMDSTSQVSTELMTAQQQIAKYNALATASEKEVNALQAAALLRQQQVEELDASLFKANEDYGSERARANELQRERDELLDFELNACAGLQELLGEVIVVKGRLIEESRGLACLLNDAAADKRALQAQCDVHAGETSSMMLKLQVLWDEKEAAVEGVQLRLRHMEQQWKLSVEREQTATQQKLYRIICRIKNSSLVSSLELWRQTAQEQVRLRLKSQKVIMRFKHSCLVSCLELWRETAQEQVQMRQEEEAREKKAQKIIYRLKNSCLVTCYDLWRDTAQEQVRTRKKTQKIILRIKCACLVHCLELWRQHHDEVVKDRSEQALQQTQNALREKLVQRSQKMMKRWLLRSHWTQWREAVIKARDATQDEIRAALEEEVKKSFERARALEKQYADTQASLQRAVQEHEEAERGWEGQQESQYESLVRRSQIFMKRWCMRSHLAIWTQTLVAARQQRLEDNVAKLSAEKASLSAASEEEKLRLVSEQERLQQKAGAECSSLSSEVDTARKELQRLYAALADFERRHDDAVSEATTSSALACALGKQTKELSAFAAETSAKLEAAQAQVRRLTAEVEILQTGSQKHEGRAGALHEEMIELKSHHSALSAQLAAKTVEFSRLETEMSEVRGELECAHAAAKELEEQLSLAREDGEEREGILAELQVQMLPALQSELVEKEITVKWLRAQVEAAQELQEHNKKEAAASEVSIAQAWAATKEAREQLLARDATIRQLNVEITDSTSNVQRLEQTELTLREAMQNLKDTVAQLREAEIQAHEMYVNLQARKEEDARRITSLVDENATLQKDKAEMRETILCDRKEMRSLKHQLGAFEERAKDLDSVVEREQAELNRQRAARKETEKLNTALMERNSELDRFYKEREASAVKALSDQLQKLKDGARKQLEDVTASCEHKSQEAESRARDARQALAQCQVELRRLLDERKSLQNRTGLAEGEVERLRGEARLQGESHKNLESEIKTLRRDLARSEEQYETSDKMLAGLQNKTNAQTAKIQQVETALKEKEQELESTTLSVDRVQAELIHERRLTQAARTQSENVTKELQLVTAKLSEEKQKNRELQNQVTDLQRRISGLSADLEAREAAMDGANTELSALSLCRKELRTTKLALEQAQMSLQDCLPGKEKAERELLKIRHQYNELVTKEMDASEQARLLQRMLDSKDKALMQHAGNAQLLDEELKTLQAHEKAMSEELLTLRRDNQRCRAEEESHRLVKSKEESKVTDLEKKLAAQHARFVSSQERLLETEKSLQEVTLRSEASKAQQEHVMSMGNFLRIKAVNAAHSEHRVRASVGLAPRCMSSSATARLSKKSTTGSKHETRNFSNSIMPIDAGECHDPDLRLYVLQRILQTWRQHSSGSSLVHAVSVLGWRHAIAAAGDVADVMEQHVQSLFPRTTASSRQSGGHISSVGEGAEAARSSNPLNGGAGVAALFAARRRLMYARGFMADFPTHMPCEATAGSSISIGAAASTNRVLGCIFVDWRGCALKQRRYRTIRVGTHSKVLDESRGELQRYLFRALAAWHQLTVQTRAELQAAEVAYPEIFEKLQSSQSAHEKSSINEDELQKTVRKVEMQFAETDQKRATAEKLVAELRAELGRFFKLPSPCGVGMELEVDMRGTVRVGALHPRMSAHSSGALSEGDIVLSIDGTKVSGDKIEDSKALLVGKRATMVSIEVERGKQTFSVNLKRGSWGPEHASVSTEQPMAITPKNSAKQNASVREPKPANLQVPSNVLPGGNVRPAWPADNPETEGMKGVQERAAAEAAAAAAAKQAEETRRESGAALEAAEDLDQVIQSRPTATRSRPQSSVGGGGGGGLGGVVVQGSYAAARRSQGSGALASTPE